MFKFLVLKRGSITVSIVYIVLDSFSKTCKDSRPI